MAGTKPVDLKELKHYPAMTNWFGVGLLAKLLGRVVVSDWFGQYADRRLMVAALDTVHDEVHRNLASQFLPGPAASPGGIKFTPDADGNVWIDYVADLGDGFDATYAIATLLAQEELELDGHTTRRGQVLIMGGDQVYPSATMENYQKRLRDPYDWAFPDPNPGPAGVGGIPVYAIPGNHDWYDGLRIFLALFCRKAEPLHLGGWRTFQHRSYFALQLTEDWWVWAMDAQLADDVDQPQKEYFVAIARSMKPGSKIILCGPEPGWIYLKNGESKSLDLLSYFAQIACKYCEGVSFPIILSGDTHHYSRYENDLPVKTQFITCGGGGAFLHPTHHMHPTQVLHEPEVHQKRTWINGKMGKTLTLASKIGKPQEEALYPSRNQSLCLLARDLLFPCYSPGFSMVLGLFYVAALLLKIALPFDALYLVPLIFFGGFWAYTAKQEQGKLKIFLVSAVNALAHSGLAYCLFSMAQSIAPVIPGQTQGTEDLMHALFNRMHWLIVAGLVTIIGGVLGGFLFGAYLYVTSRWCDMNHNDAFSCLRMDKFRGFLRIKLNGPAATIYVIGLDEVPKRDKWRRKTGTGKPAYDVEGGLHPKLVDGPIIV